MARFHDQPSRGNLIAGRIRAGRRDQIDRQSDNIVIPLIEFTQMIFDAGGVPYYTAAASNIASRSTALGLGFWPAWTDLYVTDLIRSAPE